MGSTKNVLQSFKALNAASLGADAAGPATNIEFLDNLSVHIECGAGATGTFYVQVSNVPGTTGTGPASTNWVTLPLVDSTGAAVTLAVTGSAANFFVNIPQVAASYMRLIYTRASGTGAASAWVTGKSI